MNVDAARRRFLSRTERWGDCLIWTGLIDRGGYGKRKFLGRTMGAHRIAYMLFTGDLPDGIPLDHLCHTRKCDLGTACPHRRCVNPAHLSLTTVAANTRRGLAGTRSHADYERRGMCRRGHAWTQETIRIRQIGGRSARVCVLCERDRTRRYRQSRPTR